MKRNLLLATLFTLCMSLALALCFVMPTQTAKADTTYLKVSGVEYDLSYILEEAGASTDSSAEVLVNSVNVKRSDEVTAEKQATDGKFYSKEGKKIEFLSNTNYEFKVTFEGETVEFTVDASSVPASDYLKYTLDTVVDTESGATVLDKYVEKVNEATKVTGEGDEAQDIAVDDDFKVPSIETLINNKYFDFSQLTGTLYYSAPQSTTYSSKSISSFDSLSFTLTEVGEYSYYIIVKDLLNNTMTTEDLVLGEKGWYTADSNGNPVDLVIPVFKFKVEKSTAPKITVSACEKAYIGLQYTVNCFNIVATDYTTEYTLYYSDKAYSQAEITAYDSHYLTSTLGMVEVTTDNDFETANLFNSSSKTFTPVKKGYYYVVLHVADFANEHSTRISNVINATAELQEVKYEKQFLKYNWVTVVLFGVIVVCVVAIVLLLFVKPAEKKPAVVTTTEKTNE